MCKLTVANVTAKCILDVYATKRINMTNKPYSILLKIDDIKAIEWVGNRYSWGIALSKILEVDDDSQEYRIGHYSLAEHEAWEIVDSMFSDDSAFCPCLAEDSNLAQEMFRLEQEVV